MENETKGNLSMPIGLAMALATDKASFSAFLALDDREQDRIIEKANACSTQRERQILVNTLSKDKK